MRLKQTHFDPKYPDAGELKAYILPGYIQFPDHLVAFPGTLASFPDQLVTFPDQLVTFPDHLVTFPGSLVSFQIMYMHRGGTKSRREMRTKNKNTQ